MKRAIFIVAGLFVMLLITRKWPQPGDAVHDSPLHEEKLARRLLADTTFRWEVHPFAGGHLHYPTQSYAAHTRRRLEADVAHARDRALAFLELQDTLPIEVFFVDAREDMQRLVGRPIGGMVQSGERAAVLVYNRTYHPFLVHELTHLYTHDRWGQPRHGRWISEGIATLATGECQGHTIPAIVKGLRDDGKLVSWSQLVTGFETIPELVANPQAASVVEHIAARGGVTAVREVWMSTGWGSVENALKQPIAEIEQQWLASVDTVTRAGRLDVQRLHDRGCV